MSVIVGTNNGRFRLGDKVPIAIQVVDANGVPTDPDDAPVLKVYDIDGTLVTDAYRLEPLGRPGSGHFGFDLPLYSGFSVGFHAWRATYEVSTSARAEIGVFWCMAGGHVKGGYKSLASYERPHGLFLIAETESGDVEFLKNPQV
jgi:hypothetical protein